MLPLPVLPYIPYLYHIFQTSRNSLINNMWLRQVAAQNSCMLAEALTLYLNYVVGAWYAKVG